MAAERLIKRNIRWNAHGASSCKGKSISGKIDMLGWNYPRENSYKKYECNFRHRGRALLIDK